MTAISKFYPRALYGALKKEWSWESGQIYAAILKQNYSYSDTHTHWSDVISSEIALNQSTNYTTGGKLLTTTSVVGYTANSWPTIWTANTQYPAGSVIRPTTGNNHAYLAQNSGTTAAIEPAWSTTIGTVNTDNTMLWNTCGSYVVTLQCPDIVWTNISFSNAGYVVIYDRSAPTDAQRHLIGLIDLGGSQSITSGTFTVDGPASGFFVTLTH